MGLALSYTLEEGGVVIAPSFTSKRPVVTPWLLRSWTFQTSLEDGEKIMHQQFHIKRESQMDRITERLKALPAEKMENGISV